ncbi:MAG: hypothetical protein HY690_16990 [Chloroflexi bacterium]|nr:hypothetical protein [Chloroflexota bacterium]
MAADGSVESLVARLAQERLTIFRRIAAANHDLEERLRRLEVNVCYDREDAVSYPGG